jgi:hypothetical protein
MKTTAAEAATLTHEAAVVAVVQIVILFGRGDLLTHNTVTVMLDTRYYQYFTTDVFTCSSSLRLLLLKNTDL